MKRSPSQKEKLFAEAGGACIYCGLPLTVDSFEIDHIVPKARGGSNNYENIVCSCPACNDLKKDLMPVEFIATMTDKERLKYTNRVNTLNEHRHLSKAKAKRLLEASGEEPARKDYAFRLGPYSVSLSLTMRRIQK